MYLSNERSLSVPTVLNHDFQLGVANVTIANPPIQPSTRIPITLHIRARRLVVAIGHHAPVAAVDVSLHDAAVQVVEVKLADAAHVLGPPEGRVAIVAAPELADARGYVVPAVTLHEALAVPVVGRADGVVLDSADLVIAGEPGADVEVGGSLGEEAPECEDGWSGELHIDG